MCIPGTVEKYNTDLHQQSCRGQEFSGMKKLYQQRKPRTKLINPVAENQDFICISTARASSRDTDSYLMKAFKIREESYDTFKYVKLEKPTQEEIP